MTFKEFEDLHVDRTVNAGSTENLAKYLKVSVEELNSVEYEVEENTDNDGSNCGYLISFGEGTPKAFLDKVGADSARDISVPPHAIDGEDTGDYDDEY